MTAAVQNIVFRRKDTPTLGVILDGQNIESLEIVRLPRDGQVISWTIGWPDGAATKTTEADGGLVRDERFGAIYWPILPADLARLQPRQVAPYAVQVTESDGRATTHLVGTIAVED